MYQPISQTRIKEVWGINTTDERTIFYEKANFIDPSQYHGVKDKERVITYLGETSSPLEFWIKSFSKRYLSKYTETPWRVSVYINTNILCIKLNNKAVTHEQNVPQERLNQYN